LERSALIAHEIDTEYEDTRAPAPENPHGVQWRGAWVSVDEAQAALHQAFADVLNVLESRRSKPDHDIGGVASYAVRMIEERLAEVYQGGPAIGLACARLGVIAWCEGSPVDMSPFLTHASKKLH
jgi:hypothetical protein